jgi:phosphate-selective porin OprO and OprP
MTSKFAQRALRIAGAMLLVLGVATGARAQGLFYAEETKDGRIYAFNIKENWERFKASGETGTGLTRLGVGPNGETVYADNETALELFFFKHGIKESVERPKTPPQRIEWRDGKTRFTLGDNFYLEMSNRIQPRITLEMPDDAVQLAGTGGRGDSKPSFRLRRAKFKLEGWFYKPNLEFELQMNWPDVNNTPPGQFLEDANIDWDISKKRNKAFRLRFGQFKAPYGRQQITSSGAQQFVDRGIQDARFNDARETGFALWGTLFTNKLDWRVMASNGNGRTQTANDNDKFLYTGRVMWQAVGNVRMNQWASGALLTEGDLGDSLAANGPLLAVAGQYSNNDRFNTTTAVDLRNRTFGFDYTFKYKGFASVAEANWRESRPETGTNFDSDGFLVQASYAWRAPGIPGASFWEIAGRYVRIEPSDLVANNDQTETGVALNYYYNRHNLKVQVDWRQIKDDAANSGAGTKNNEFRLQTQFIF